VRRPTPIVALCVVLSAMLGPAWQSAGAADHSVAVALFYAPTPLTTYAGLIPEEYASAGMSAKLAAATAGRLVVVPRADVKTRESGMRWRESDALRFARLSDLAHAAGADRLVVGWIQVLALDHLGGGGAKDLDASSGEGGGLLDGFAVMVVQVFDASQGRIVYQTSVTGRASGMISMRVVQATLDDAVRRAVVQVVGPLTAVPGLP
jgi:hypothetical protein